MPASILTHKPAAAVPDVNLCCGTYPADMTGLALLIAGAPDRLETQVAPWQPPVFAVLPSDLPRPVAAQPGLYEGEPDVFAVRPTLGLCTAVVSPSALLGHAQRESHSLSCLAA